MKERKLTQSERWAVDQRRMKGYALIKDSDKPETTIVFLNDNEAQMHEELPNGEVKIISWEERFNDR